MPSQSIYYAGLVALKRFLGLLAIGLLAPALPAGAYDLIQNGGFETAPLASWQTFNQGSMGGQGSWYSHSSGNGTYSGLPTSPPPVGSRQAVADNSGRAAAILYQDIVIPATTRATLSFVLWHGNAAPGGSYVNGSSLSPGSTNQRIRVDLIDLSTGLLVTSSGVIQLLYQTGASTPVIVNPTTITADVTALAGQTVRLRAALVATNGGLIAGLDNVQLDVSPFAIQAGPPPGMYYTDARWGDFDNDGRLEIAMTGEVNVVTRGSWIERWSPTGGLWEHMMTLPSGYSLAPADVDGDGDLDLGLSGFVQSGSIEVAQIINDGLGGFSISYQPIGATDGSIQWGDYDRDGDLDALLTGISYWSGSPATYLGRNDGTGALSMVDAGLRGVWHTNAVWADVDNSGTLDVALTGGSLTDFYFGDGYGGFTNTSSGLVDITGAGEVAMGDLDNDGVEELVVVGHRNFNPPAAKVFKYDGLGSWNEMPAGLTGVYSSSVALGDFDHDGWLDIATCGTTGSQTLTSVYHNNGNGTFTDIGANLEGVSLGALEFGDFEGDGDLDLMYQGMTQGSASVITRVAINTTPTTNAPPEPPGILFSQLSDAELLIRFGEFGNDDHTPPNTLTRNFRAGTSPGACDLVPPMSDLATGRRLIPHPGESRGATWKRLALNGIGHGYQVKWSVQNVDQSYLGSAWALEQTVVLGPTVLQVADIPNDQGGHVRVTVEKSAFDDPARTTYAATGYNVWRLVPGTLASQVAREGAALQPASADEGAPDGDLKLIEWNGRRFTRSVGLSVASPFPAGTWEIVASFFATQQSSYVVATTTLADSGSSGTNDQTYIVTTHTTTPSVWFASLPISGHSVDNIAPGPPVGLAAAHHTGSGNQLSWQPAPELDFASFRIYRGATPGFVAGPANLVASVPGPAWTDPSYDAPIVYYKVSTTDHAGNESPAVAPGTTTAVDDDVAPVAFALREAWPNPFAGATRIALAVAKDTQARLDVFDTSGRLVSTLLNGRLPVGEHEVSWHGDDRSGRRVQAGVYFYRLEAGPFSASRRVVVLP